MKKNSGEIEYMRSGLFLKHLMGYHGCETNKSTDREMTTTPPPEVAAGQIFKSKGGGRIPKRPKGEYKGGGQLIIGGIKGALV